MYPNWQRATVESRISVSSSLIIATMIQWNRRKYNESQLREAVAESFSWRGVVRHLNCLSQHEGNYRTLKSTSLELGIDFSHFKGQGWNAGGSTVHNKISNEDLFVENSSAETSIVRRRVLAEGLLEVKCSTIECVVGPTVLNPFTGKVQPTPLDLDHINGNNSDHRLENLRFLCVLCHSLTPTYKNGNIKQETKINPKKICKCGGDVVSGMKCATCIILKPSSVKLCKCGNTKDAKAKACMSCYNSVRNQIPKKSKIDWPSTQELLDRVKATSYTQVGKELGVSDNAVRKRIKNHPIV